MYTIVTANAKPAVLMSIYRQPIGNTVTVANEVHKEIEQIRRTLPRGIELNSFYDQSEIVNDSIDSVRDAILIGLVLASLILVLFLRDWGTSLVAGLVIPATIAVTFIALRVLGESFNLMTLGGLAAAVGLVIDDAIVVVENIITHRDSGQSRADAIRSALREIRVPLLGSTFTPIVVFLPLIAITGVTGVFFRSLAVTVGVALLTSLALALTWTPTLSHFLIRKRGGTGPRRTREPINRQAAPPARRMRVSQNSPDSWPGPLRVYQLALRGALEHPWLVGFSCLVLIVGSYYCYHALGTDLLPAMDEGGFILDYWMPSGSSLEETNRVLTGVEEMLRDMPEVESTSRRTGLELGLIAVTEANTGDYAVKLKRDRSRSVDEVTSEVREKIAEQYPMLEVEFVQLLQDMIGDLTSAPEPVEIKLFSSDEALLHEWAPAGRGRDRRDSRRGGCSERDRQHDQRTGHHVPGGSDGRRARRIHARRSGDERRCDHARRGSADPGGDRRPRLSDPDPIPRCDASLAGGDAEHDPGECFGSKGDPWLVDSP